MRVESVQAFPVRIKATEKLAGGAVAYSHFQTVLVRAVCDGIDGWGEAMTRFDLAATASLVRYLSGMAVGRSFGSPYQAWSGIWRELRLRGHTRGSDVEALSGIEIALYDCWGKAQRRPVSRLLSRAPKKKVGAYAGSLFESRGPLEEQVRRARAAGLMGAKVKVGFTPRADLDVLVRVRKEWDDGMLVADANGAYDSRKAAEACRLFEGLGLAWFEEPLPSDEWEGYRRLRRASRVPLGAGESWFGGDLAEALKRGLVDVLEPSVSRCGGIGVEVDAGRKAGGLSVKFSPMCGMNSAISLAASLHVASSVPTVGVEYDPFANPLLRELATGLSEPRNGEIRVPTRPGLGIEVDQGFVKKHAA